MKKFTALLLVLCMMLATVSPVSAAPTVSPAVVVPTTQQQQVINAFWQYTGDQHALLTQVLNTYFQLSDPSTKQAFLVAYEDVITALAGYGDKIESFGLTAQVLDKLDKNMSTGPNSTYSYFVNKDKAGFERMILSNWSMLERDFGTAMLDRLVFGLNKVYPMTRRYVQMKDDALVKSSMRVMGYSQGTNTISSLIDYNIRGLIGKANLWLNLSISYDSVQPALTRMQTFYNGLGSADKGLVYSTLNSQGMLYKRISLGSLTSTMTTLTGSVEAGQMLRATVNGTPLTPSGVNSDSSGNFTFSGFTPLAANAVVVVEAYAENGGNPQVLDSASVTVQGAAVPPTTTTTPVVPPTPTTTTTTTTVVPPTTTTAAPVVPPTTTAAPVVVPPTPATTAAPVVPPTTTTTVRTTIATIAPQPTTQPTSTVTIDDPETGLGDLTFTDILKLDWAREAINEMVAKGVIKGKTKDSFAPQDELTRAEFSVLLTRLLKLQLDVSKSTFKDVKGTDWFAKEVQTVFMNNLIKGITSDHFNPKGNITRQEMSVVLGRILAINKIFVKNDNILKQFADLSSIKKWALYDTKLTVQEGIIQGRQTTNAKKQVINIFAPAAHVTRAEAAVMLYRLSGKVPTGTDVAGK